MEENKTCETVSLESGEVHESQWDCNGWTIVAGVELLLIILIIAFKRRKMSTDKMRTLKRGIASEEVDFDNILNSAFNSGALYDKLKVKCHPDRFSSDDIKNAVANELFQEITKNKNNLKKLQELKERAKTELGIDI